MSTRPIRFAHGVTMLELLVGIAITAILVGIAVPSLRDWMIAQRVAAVASELATDMRYARSEATSANMAAGVVVNAAGKGCYVVYRGPVHRTEQCDCTKAPGSMCPDKRFVELKIVTMPTNGDVAIAPLVGDAARVEYRSSSDLIFEGNKTAIKISGGSARELRVEAAAGVLRPTVCKPAGSTIPGTKPCS